MIYQVVIHISNLSSQSFQHLIISRSRKAAPSTSGSTKRNAELSVLGPFYKAGEQASREGLRTLTCPRAANLKPSSAKQTFSVLWKSFFRRRLPLNAYFSCQFLKSTSYKSLKNSILCFLYPPRRLSIYICLKCFLP